jgi:hypothetical protein
MAQSTGTEGSGTAGGAFPLPLAPDSLRRESLDDLPREDEGTRMSD